MSQAVYNTCMEKQTLLKALTRDDIGSRRKIAEAIKGERVTVNGDIVTVFNHMIDLKKDKVLLEGRAVVFKPQRFVYLALNKPKGMLSTVRDERGRRTVIDMLPEKYRNMRLYPVGRLDKDSTGLILLTNDGDLAYRLTHPGFEHEKEYHLRIEVDLDGDEIKRLENGIELEDGKTAPAKVEKLGGGKYGITIHEGKKRQLRRMFAALGHSVIELKRVRMGSLKLGNLKEGEVREVRRDII
ncbi:MAG TPA: rRNA pseudouridine synthase [Dehalococcoidia bacterium]|nr:rRNA pseudouridine synthase [Dehalococcoidia bacterium]